MIFKKNKKNMENQEIEDRLRVLLALEISETDSYGPCPDPNDMAAYIDDVLEADKRKQIEQHIFSCEECFDVWRSVSSLEAESKTRHVITELKEAVTDFMNRFTRPKSFFAYGLTTAVAVCLIMTLWLVQGSDLKEAINNSYTKHVISSVSQDALKFNDSLKLPWEQTEALLGFAPLTTDTETALAFGAGLWSGRQEILADDNASSTPDFVKKEWEKSSKAIDFWLGHWSYLLRSVLLSNNKISTLFWKDQLAILIQIQEKYSDVHDKDNELIEIVYNRRLTHIKNTIESILSDLSNENSYDRKKQMKIVAELNLLIEYLSPRLSDAG